MALPNNTSVHILSPETIGPELLATDTLLSTGTAWTANLLIFIPLIIQEPLIASQFFWYNGATVNGNTDVGIYTFDGQTKLGSTGSTVNAGASQIQVVDVTNFTLPPNVKLWLALGSDSATHTFIAANLAAIPQDSIGITQQGSGWSSGLPTTITPAVPAVAKLPMFGFTGASVI